MTSLGAQELKILAVTRQWCNKDIVYCIHDQDRGHYSDPLIFKTIQNLVIVIETGTFPTSLDGLDRNEAKGVNARPHLSITLESKTPSTFSVLNNDTNADGYDCILPRTKPIVSICGSVGETEPGQITVAMKRHYLLSGAWLYFTRSRYVFKSKRAEHDLLKAFFSTGDPKAATLWRDNFAHEYKQYNCQFLEVRKPYLQCHVTIIHIHIPLSQLFIQIHKQLPPLFSLLDPTAYMSQAAKRFA